MATSKQARQATAYYVRVSSQSQDIRSQIPEMEEEKGTQLFFIDIRSFPR
jgi:hypothetical protein